MYDFGEGPDMFMALEPSLLWSRARLEGGKADFFQDAVGRARWDGKSLDYEDTNMTQNGQLGTPISFRRREIFVFPGQAYDVLDNYAMWTRMIQRARIGDLLWDRKISEYQDMRFYPDGAELPVPATYGRPDYIDMVKDSQPVRDFLKSKPPCKVIRSDRIFKSIDILGTGIRTDEEFDGFAIYVVYVGTLWVPKPHDEMAKSPT